MEKNEITTGELAGWLEQPDFVLLDIRPVAAYNGWSLRNEPRGGHIRGARTFPLEWTRHKTWKDLLKDKGIEPGRPVGVYGYDRERSLEMAGKLQDAGFGEVKCYHHFVSGWSPDRDLPVERLKRYRQLVYPEWVKTLVSGNNPPEYENKDNFTLCHAHYAYPRDYHEGHIPGAIPLDTVDLEDPETWNRRSPGELAGAMRKYGINSESTVILYGRFSEPRIDDPYPGKRAGHLAAMRCALIMLYAGVKDIRILNGGFAAWKEAGYEITTQEYKHRTPGDFGVKIPAHPELLVDTPEAKKILKYDRGELVSIRSMDEFTGKVSGYNYIDKAGRIPGAVFGNCGRDAYHMENYRNIDHTMREYHEVASNWAENGILPEKYIAFYCGTGWRASEAFFNAYFMGWPRISVYDGGWMEWSADPDNPVETG